MRLTVYGGAVIDPNFFFATADYANDRFTTNRGGIGTANQGHSAMKARPQTSGPAANDGRVWRREGDAHPKAPPQSVACAKNALTWSGCAFG